MLGTILETQDGINGNIRTYSMNENFTLIANQDRHTNDSPTHTIAMTGKHGQLFDAGVAWKGKDKNGKSYFSCLFEVPELFDGKFACVGWANKNAQGEYDLVVSTDRDQEKQAA